MWQLEAKSMWNFMLSYVILSGLLLVACAPEQKSPELSAMSVPESSAIVVKRVTDKSMATLGEVSITAPQDSDVDEFDGGRLKINNSVIDSIIWQIQTGKAAALPPDPVIPEGQDPSLTEDALEAAFSLLSNQVNPPQLEPDFILSAKAETELRIGLLVPLSGQHAALGDEIRRGVEMALFKASQDNLTLVFLDTGGGEKAAEAALTGVQNGVDIFIGPLFTSAVLAART
ncbi:MAG: hypothetical protein ACJ0BO_00740, partial [Candidatus Puniceispirillaceae bacterium]